MRKKIIYVMTVALLGAGVSIGLNNAESKAAYPCKNGVVKGDRFAGFCVGEGPDCFRCKIFASAE
jgi:hypothetical protein